MTNAAPENVIIFPVTVVAYFATRFGEGEAQIIILILSALAGVLWDMSGDDEVKGGALKVLRYAVRGVLIALPTTYAGAWALEKYLGFPPFASLTLVPALMTAFQRPLQARVSALITGWSKP
jgi:hypothetical protein